MFVLSGKARDVWKYLALLAEIMGDVTLKELKEKCH